MSDNDSIFKDIEELKNKILTLNKNKNSYVQKKLNNKHSESDEKELISSLIYIVAEVRNIATKIGVSEDGKVNKFFPNMQEFIYINDSVKNLKSQIMFLTKATISDIKQEMTKQRENTDTSQFKNLTAKEKLEKRMEELKKK